MEEYGGIIFWGVLLGFLGRFLMLRSDYRQYPTYPHGYVTHLSLGLIAAFLGAITIPALATKEFTAATFLALAAQQFREVREMERKTLATLEENEIIPRGADYIEGIARTFEARNYLTMLIALTTSLTDFFVPWPLALVVGSILIFLFVTLWMQGEVIGDIAQVIPAPLSFEGPILKVEKVVIMNVGLPAAREKISREGQGILIKPKNDNARTTLHNVGQRQAILHTAAALVGTKAEVGEQEWTPLIRKNIESGELALFILPQEKDLPCLIEAINRVPVLESAKRSPLNTKAGRIAAD